MRICKEVKVAYVKRGNNMVRFLKACISGLLSIVMVLLCTAAVLGMLALGVGLFHIAGHGTIGVWRYDLSLLEQEGGRELILSEELSSLTPLRDDDTVVFLDLSEEGHRVMLPLEAKQSGSITVRTPQDQICVVPEEHLLGRVIYRTALPPILDRVSGKLPGGNAYLWYWLGGGWLAVCVVLFFCSIWLRRVIRRRQIRKELTKQHVMPESSVDLSALVMPEDPVELVEIPPEEEIPLLTIEDMYAATERKRRELAEQSKEEKE